MINPHIEITEKRSQCIESIRKELSNNDLYCIDAGRLSKTKSKRIYDVIVRECKLLGMNEEFIASIMQFDINKYLESKL
jgi:hypothetical protein